MLINKEMKLSDVILLNYKLIHVIARFDIQLGFGDQTIEEICRAKKLSLFLFLHVVNVSHDESYTFEKNIEVIPVIPLIDYLIATHNDYLSDKLIVISDLLGKLHSSKEDEKYIAIIRKFFNGYREELITHIKEEEEVVFPYVLALNKSLENKILSKKEKAIVENFTIQSFKETHDEVEEKLRDMIAIMIKYLNPPENISRYYQIIQKLFMLADDVVHHTRIEEKILIPRVELMEKSAKNIPR